MAPPHLEKIISGGQTGVDRAGLNAALQLGIAHGGWCPAGRRAEDGTIPPRYELEETTARNYRSRTAKNVKDADATLIMVKGPVTSGTQYTIGLAKKHKKPFYKVDLTNKPDPIRVANWLVAKAIRTLNVAGPSESKRPGIGAEALAYLLEVLRSAPRARPRRR